MIFEMRTYLLKPGTRLILGGAVRLKFDVVRSTDH